MNKAKALKSDVESGTKRKRYADSKRLTDLGTVLNPNQDNFRVAIYTRASKGEQDNGHSLDAQRNACIAFAQKRGWQVRDVYEDSGFSAKDVQRPAFKKMMTDAGNNLFDVVLVYKLDRFSRNIGDMLSSLKYLDDNKIAFTSVEENFEFSSTEGRLLNMMTVFD
jgi:site-specific DNA recombinase